MVDILKLFVILILSILCIDLIIALLYIVPVVLVRRFHTHHNILIANVAFVSLCCAWFYIFAYAIMFQYPTIWNEIIPLCVILQYVTITVNFLLVYSFITVIFNRYLTIVYPLKLFFRTRSWVFVCIGIAWLVGIILGILRLVASLRFCLYKIEMPSWDSSFIFVTLIIIPSCLIVIFDVLIYVYIQSSSRRVHPTTINLIRMTRQHGRDIYLLKHMLFIFTVFVLGWAPTVITILPGLNDISDIWIFVIVRTLPVISATIIGLDLFIYNHELRRYLKRKLFRLILSQWRNN